MKSITLFPLNNGITVQSECPIGLIGDDIGAVAKVKAKELDKTIVPVNCEGFRGVISIIRVTTLQMTRFVTMFLMQK